MTDNQNLDTQNSNEEGMGEKSNAGFEPTRDQGRSDNHGKNSGYDTKYGVNEQSIEEKTTSSNQNKHSDNPNDHLDLNGMEISKQRPYIFYDEKGQGLVRL